MRLLNDLTCKVDLSKNTLKYIKRYQKTLKHVISTAKKQYNDTHISHAKHLTKEMCKIINRNLGNSREHHVTYCINRNSEKITHPQLVVEAFNSYFIDKIDEIIENNKSNKGICNNHTLLKPNQLSMFLFPVSENEIETTVGKLKGNRAIGFDEIPDFIVKDSIQLTKKTLCFIFNLSITLGLFPDWMKIAKIKPIHKKGRKDDMSNYRPISILPVF